MSFFGGESAPVAAPGAALSQTARISAEQRQQLALLLFLLLLLPLLQLTGVVLFWSRLLPLAARLPPPPRLTLTLFYSLQPLLPLPTTTSITYYPLLGLLRTTHYH